MIARRFLVLVSVLGVACGPSPDRPTTIAPAPRSASPEATRESPPLGQLPRDVTPEHYTLALTIDPTQERFSGSARIAVRLDRPRDVIWMHGKGLEIADASVRVGDAEPIEATFEQVDDEGVAALQLPRAIGPGEAVISITYSANFGTQLEGLYRVHHGGDHYAFTQMEPISAREAFPSFDEPRFKTPFDVSLVVRDDHQAAANTPVVEEHDLEGERRRLRYATTQPMPTYLVAWAVGPLDIVEADPIPPNEIRSRPLPFRGIAPRGQGERLAYALEHTPQLLAVLEEYFASEYPYAKLDIVAVPDFGAGAMENVGLVTFREYFLLFDENAPQWQLRTFAYIMAHELAHMWFGNLVTMPWWDDIWLNEAFATWMGNKAVREVHPEYEGELSMLESVQRAMRSDSLVSARQIRQPIETNHDISNAFDSITYSKGGGVLEMFERYLGFETFREGLRLYMNRHAWGNATYEDLLAALSEASGHDIGTAFRTFLFQPGIPQLEMQVACTGSDARLELSQSRYLPAGSTGSQNQEWDLPVCIRYQVEDETHQTCSLVTERIATIELDGDACPSWVMPNADGAGYFRFALSAEDLDHLQEHGRPHLTPRERLALADSLKASFQAASMTAPQFYGSLLQFARDEVRPVASMPAEPLGFAREYLVVEEAQPTVEGYTRELYQPRYRELGWGPRRGGTEDGERQLLRAQVIGTLASVGQDLRVRRELTQRGQRYVGYRRDGELHPDAVDPNLVASALSVAVQDSDAAFFDHVLNLLWATEDGRVRSNLIDALASTKDPALSARVLELTFDERVRSNEVTRLFGGQMAMAETRPAAWVWLKENIDRVTARISPFRVGSLPWYTTGLCSEAGAEEVASFFQGRIEDLPGGPRNLLGALEAIRLCAAQVGAHHEGATEFFAEQ